MGAPRLPALNGGFSLRWEDGGPGEVLALWRKTYYIILYIEETFILRYLIFLLLSRAATAAYGISQTRGLIGAIAAGPHHSHSKTGSEMRL